MLVFENLHAFIWDSMTQNNCNTYLIDGPTRILIDPGHLALFDHVREGLSELKLDLEALGFVLCTHAHPDHIEAIQLFKDTPALAALNELDWQLVKDMLNQFGNTAQIRLESIQPDFFVKEGDLSINGLEFKVFHTPGHSPGSVSLYWPQQKALFTGDLMFKEGVGRTDLPGGNGTQIKESIRRLSNLDVEWLLSGHGDIISGKTEVRRNFDQIEQFWFAYV
jgi:glyoxylase-like metal-dependent hydrolase (beta-lactamase superfamily II)